MSRCGARVAAMLEASSIAVVGASDRPGSLGQRMAMEALRSPSSPRVHLVNPRLRTLWGHDCLPSLADVPEPVDLVLLGVGDKALVGLLETASARGDSSAVIFGSAVGLAGDLRATAGGMAVCGAGCMGFVNVARGVRAIGYVEQFPLPPGPVALVTHSGSVFSSMLRSRRRLEYSVVVSAGQEIVTTAAEYLSYALSLEETRVVGLVLETMRDVPGLRAGLRSAVDRDIPVVALTVGGSPTGRAMVSAHSGALAGDDAGWEALFAAYGVHRVRDLDELGETLEMFAIGRRVRATGGPLGIATVHDSGAERALVADLAHEEQVPFGSISSLTRDRLHGLLDPGLIAENPLDVWGGGADTERLFTDCMAALAADESVAVVALAVDLVAEYDGDESYPLAAAAALSRTDKPVVVLANVSAAVDQERAGFLRARGVPVLEGTRSGLRALGHLLAQASRRPGGEVDRPVPVDPARQARWRTRIATGPLDAETSFALLEDYGLRTAAPRAAHGVERAVEAADAIGYPVVVKTDEPGVDHKTEVGGVLVDLGDTAAVRAAAAAVSGRLGPRLVVQPQVAPGTELAIGIVRDPLLGPLVLVAAGGTLIEVLGQRAVALPPVGREQADTMLDGLPVGRLLAGVRGAAAADRSAVIDAVVAVSQLAVELGDVIEALDVNPLIAGPAGVLVVDTLLVPRASAGS
jgi:acyl-CoA synthetase (NDP forming)